MTETHDETTLPEPIDLEQESEKNGIPKRLRGLKDAQDEVPSHAVGRSEPSRMDLALEHAKICARIGYDNRGKNIQLLDLRGATPLIDYFVIISAASRRQASSIAFDIDAEMKKVKELKMGIEGAEEGRWTLIDYGDFVVHVFSEEARSYYDLEQIWADAPKIEWQDPLRAKPPAGSREEA